MNNVTIFDVATFFLSIADRKEADITNMKLQKLCYYAQGVYLAVTDGEPLFDNEFLHWEHGPVCKELWQKYTHYGSNVIPEPSEDTAYKFTEKQIEILNDVYSYFGQFSAWKLRNMTHNETPWINTNNNEIIPKDMIKTYFKNYIING